MIRCCINFDYINIIQKYVVSALNILEYGKQLDFRFNTMGMAEIFFRKKEVKMGKRKKQFLIEVS